ncbi:choline/carnitine O-acyltransferase [Actinocorallia lasiicapitis]
MNSTPRTFELEPTLPRVPLPALEDTCARFLDWCAPLLTDEQFAQTRREVQAFLDGPGPVLHSALADFDASPGVHSWLDLFWPSRYLGRRDRIAVNANFLFLFADSPLGQTERAAALIAGAVDYKLRLDAETVPPLLLRGKPLAMDQNKYLFATTRIPGERQDTVRAPYSDAEPGPAAGRHILVFHRRHLFRLDVLTSDGRPYAAGELAGALDRIVKETVTALPVDEAAGSLTTKARAEWAASRAALAQANAAALEDVETALFTVCLDDLTPADDREACDQLLAGDSGNRWFDKAVSFIVFADGTAGINVEHCGLDGTTILSFVDDVLTGDPAPAGPGTPAVAPVRFVLDDAQRADIAAAASAFDAYAAGTATTTVSFPDFGTGRAKQLGVSPDAFVQLAYQLAHRRAKGLTGATYESIATRHFRAGRTEAMRVVTPEVVAFADTFTDPSADRAGKLAAFRAAADAHVRRAKECQAGQAPEQHLWELQLIAGRRPELGVEGPIPLFSSPGWTVSRDDYLSTSSAPSVNIKYFGFGMTSTQCIGVAYVLLPDRFNLYLATPVSVADAMHTFAAELRVAVAELQELLSGDAG